MAKMRELLATNWMWLVYSDRELSGNLSYGYVRQDSAYPWEQGWVATERRHEEDFWGDAHTLFLDLGAGYMDVLNL